ncbi:AAA family ATPase [Candidatus Dojkabacteria bacterium]|jgi:ATP-dependent protease Clp ATPase subunit|nr:AAA family ATPase [Candidatus Dojkabacteria bacterium]
MKESEKIVGQTQLTKEITKIFKIFKASNSEIRPHFILTGPSGSGKSFTIASLCDSLNLPYVEINAAQLTKEGISGNSVSKALTPLSRTGGKPTVCFVDEYDKLFVSGNCNSDLAHESTNGVQNEFLKILESDETAIFGDYGKYINISIKNVLFIFAGAFNGEDDITLDRLRELGLKTEFLGRVGLVFNTQRLTLDDLYLILDTNELLDKYLSLFKEVKLETVKSTIKSKISENFENNTLGARMITTLIHQYFIKGGFKDDNDAKKVTFQTQLTL